MHDTEFKIITGLKSRVVGFGGAFDQRLNKYKCKNSSKIETMEQVFLSCHFI